MARAPDALAAGLWNARGSWPTRILDTQPRGHPVAPRSPSLAPSLWAASPDPSTERGGHSCPGGLTSTRPWHSPWILE